MNLPSQHLAEKGYGQLFGSTQDYPHGVVDDVDISLEFLDPLYLHSLSIDFRPDGSAGIIFPFCTKHLALISLSRIDVPLLKIIATHFSRLITHSISVVTKKAPIPDVF
jgi:hypothetical protein